VQEGKRYLAGTWPPITAPFVNGANDPCNGNDGRTFIRT
jgi:hypothetical protein